MPLVTLAEIVQLQVADDVVPENVAEARLNVPTPGTVIEFQPEFGGEEPVIVRLSVVLLTS